MYSGYIKWRRLISQLIKNCQIEPAPDAVDVTAHEQRQRRTGNTDTLERSADRVTRKCLTGSNMRRHQVSWNSARGAFSVI